MKTYLQIVLNLLAIIVGNAVAWGAGSQTIRTDPDYLIQTWETKDGLPENSATAIAQTPDGYIWFGTFAGLVRFNGVEFTVFNPANTPELPSDGIVNLHAAKDGRLWISTLGGLVVLDGTQWRQLTRNKPNVADYARTITERANGDLLITAFDGKFFQFSNGQLTELPPPPGDKGDGYFGGVDEDGHWWAVQYKFIGRFENGRWVPMIARPKNIKREVACGAARDGGLWLLDELQLIRLRHGAEVARVTLADTPGSVWSLTEDSQGNVWIATFDKGICRVAPDGTMTRWSSANGWFDRTRCVFEDRERNLWMGTSGDGLTRFTPRRFRFFDLQGEHHGQALQSIWPDSGNGLWAGTDGHGLLHLSEAGVTNVMLPDAVLGPQYVNSVLVDRAGQLWVGTSSDAVWILGKGGARHLPPSETGGHNVQALFEDSRGRVWVSGGSGIAVIDGNEARAFGPDEGLPVSVVSGFAEDASGAIWLSNGNGVFHTLGDHNLVEVRDAADQSIRDINCLYADSEGAMWLGTADRGLLRFKNGRLASFDARTGFPADAIRGMVADANGFLWMTSGDSILRARLKELRAVADGQVKRIEWQVFDASDGLPNAEFPLGRQPTSFRDAKGRLWFGMTKGVVMTDPAALRLNDIPPPVRVEWISFFKPSPSPTKAALGEEVQSQLHAPYTAPLSLPAGSRRLEIHYTALSYVAPEKIKFQVSLDGGEGNWQDTGNRRVAYYYDLAPGDHVFRVRAANNDGVWNVTGVSLVFTVQPFYWQTWWFRGLAGGLLVAAGGGAVWLWLRTRLRRALERARLADELRESEQRMALATDAANLGLWIRDLATDEIWATDKWRALFGFGKTETVDFDGVLKKLHPADRDAVRQGLSRTYLGEADYETEYRVLLPDGGVRWIVSRARAQFNSGGKAIRLRGVSMDITARKQAEEKFHLVVDASPMGIVLVNNEGRIVLVNSQTETIFGYPRQELIGQAVEILLPERFRSVHPGHRSEFLGAPQARMMGAGRELFGRRKEGTEFPVEIGLTPIQSAEGMLILTAIVDITARRQSEFELAQQRNEVAHLARVTTLGEISGSLAHELSQPLGAILTNAEAAELHLQRQPPNLDEVRAILAEIRKDDLRAGEIIHGIRAFLRRRELEMQPLELDQLAGDAARLVTADALTRKVTISFDIPTPLPRLLGDRIHLQQVLVNLLVNAMDAMSACPVPLRRITVRVARPNPHAVEIAVRDAGTGVPPASLGKVFDAFHTTKPAGLGLGLAICRSIVEAHGGSISIENNLDRGATVRFTLPVRGEDQIP